MLSHFHFYSLLQAGDKLLISFLAWQMEVCPIRTTAHHSIVSFFANPDFYYPFSETPSFLVWHYGIYLVKQQQ